jgi:hypothetical protein
LSHPRRDTQIDVQIWLYLDGGATAQQFMEWLEFDCVRSRGLAGLVRRAMVGHRGHCWSYDGPSLLAFVQASGFAGARLVSPGETTLADTGELDLREREGASLYLEAVRQP